MRGKFAPQARNADRKTDMAAAAAALRLCELWRPKSRRTILVRLVCVCACVFVCLSLLLSCVSVLGLQRKENREKEILKYLKTNHIKYNKIFPIIIYNQHYLHFIYYIRLIFTLGTRSYPSPIPAKFVATDRTTRDINKTSRLFERRCSIILIQHLYLYRGYDTWRQPREGQIIIVFISINNHYFTHRTTDPYR